MPEQAARQAIETVFRMESPRLVAGLARFTRGAPAPVYYLAGPPAMVQAMKAILARMGTGAADVRSEEFYGY